MMDPAQEKAEKPALSINDSPAKGPASIGTPSTTTGPHPPPSPLSGCYLLVVLPEPHTAQHKDLILNRVAKGFLSWDKDNCHVDLEKELQALVVQSPEGEEARNGERLIQYATENLVTEILIHPQTNTLLQCIRNLLASFTKHRHIIHAGYTFGENGSWILQDGTFSLADFLDAFNEHDVQRVLRAYENSVTVDINCAGIGEWSTQRFSKEPCTRTCRVRLNPDDVLTAGVPAITSFTKYIEQYLVPQTLDQLMQPSDVVGNIRFSHPTLYVFPGGQGDAALFGINGFNMLVDGGFARKSCFWDFTRHLDRLDAVLLTRINNSNVAGMSSVLAKKRDMQVYPQIGHFFCNLAERKHSNSPDGDKDLDPLVLSLTELGQEMMLNLKHINLRPHPCYRDPEPINLYHKVGHGTLDMYVLSPSKESREVREFLAKWNSGDWKLFAGSHKKDNNLTFPIQNMISICAMIVWLPANPDDTITRILFPGSTPQHKIFEGMERLRHLEFLKHPICSAKSISPSASLVTLKDKPVKQKLGLIDREMKRAVEIKKQKREIEKTEKVDVKPTKKSVVVENKKVDADVEENKTSKTIIETKEVKETKKVEKELKKTEVTKTEKTATKEIKARIEKKKEEETKAKELPMRFITGKTGKTEVISEKKIKEKPAPKKDSRANGISSKPDHPKAPISKPAPKLSAKSQPAAPKSAKDANNRKVVEQKNIERMSIAASATRSSAAKTKAPAPAPAPVGSEKKPVPRRPKPAAVSPSKARMIGGSPVKSAKSTPAASAKSDKDGVLRKIKSGAGDSSTVSTPSAIEVDSLAKFTDKCLTEKSEDMSLDSIESKVLADMKEERKVVEEIEAVLQKAERIEGARKAEHLEGEDEVTGDITAEKKDITEDMTEDDVTADIDEVPRKSPIRKASHEQMTEEEDEYLIIEKEEGYTEDSVHSGEHEHKHFLDAVESEKEKAKEETPEKSKIDLAESDESEGENDEESGGEEKEVAEEKGMTEDREKSDDFPEKKLPVGETQETILEDKEKSPIAEYKEQLKEEMKGIIMSAAEIVQKTEDKDDSGKKDSEDLKEISSLSPEKLDSSEKKTDTDIKPEIDQKTKEKLEESQEKISTVESGQTTTAPTLPEDERMSVDVVKPAAIEKPMVDDKKTEILKPKEIAPLAAEPTEVKPDTRTFNIRQGVHVLQREIVKTPDEVADLPVHEEVDPILYKMEDFEKPKDVKAPAVQDVKDAVEKDQKGVFGFFGKVADKFEKGMDKLTGKTRRDSEKDVDEKSSSKSGSPKDERRQLPIIEGLASKERPDVIQKIDEPALKKEPAMKKESPEKTPTEAPIISKVEQTDLVTEKTDKSLLGEDHKLAEEKNDLEDVEALLEEASKKFKDVKDSIHDSLESLDEKVAEEEFNRASELAESVKNEVKGTLEEVVGKLENIQPDSESSKGPDKVQFTIPKAEVFEDEDDDDDDDDDDDIPFKNVRGAVRDVGGVLAGTAGIIIEDKPKDVVEIVKKVAEVLKEDDFLSDEILFKEGQSAGIEQPIEKTSAEPTEVMEKPCVKKTIDTTPILSSPIDEIADKKTSVEAMCEDLMDDYSPVHTRAKRSLENLNQETGLDVLEAGLEEVCQKVHIPEPKDAKRGSMEIDPSEISFDHKIAPDTAEFVIVSPDSQPPSPKFANQKIQSKSDEKDEIETIISHHDNITEIIEEMVFVKKKKITVEIIEIIRVIKRVPKEQILHIIEEIVLKKKVPRSSVVEDGILDDETEEMEEEEKEIDSSVEQLKYEIETEIFHEYVSKNKKLTRTIIEEIHTQRKVPIRIIIEIIEKIVMTRKVRRQSIADVPDDIWNEMKSSDEPGEEPEGDEEEEEIFDEKIKSEIETEIVNDYVTKGKKLTKNIIEEIHIRHKVPMRIVMEIIEKIVIIRKISRQSIFDFPDATWNEMKSSDLLEEEPEEKPDRSEEKEMNEDPEMIADGMKSEIETEIVNDYVTKGKKMTKNIIEEIHFCRKVPMKKVIEIIEEIVISRKISRQSFVDFSDAAWSEFKSSNEPENESGEIEEKEIQSDSEMTDEKLASQMESEIINEYVSKSKKLTRSIIEEIHVKHKIPKSVIIEIIERITITRKIPRQSIVDLTEVDWEELKSSKSLSEHSETEEEDIEEDDELLEGFVQIPAKSAIDKFHRESDKLDDFEAVEQEYKISGAKAILEKGRIGIEENVDTDNSDIIEADDVLKPKIDIDKSKPSPLTAEILHKVDEKERKPSLVGIEDIEHEKPEVHKGFPEDSEKEDKDAPIVRRMIVTATSEDGGEETEVCPTGSITFTKTVSPDDSLRASPIKTAADKDSLQSTASTMETDSLNKTLSYIHDSETLDDSIEEKPLELSFDKKETKEIGVELSEIEKLDDHSPAESMIESPLLVAAKDLPKIGITESKDVSRDAKVEETIHIDEKDILDVKKSPEVSESSKSSSPVIAQKDEIELSLDKSTSSSITSILQGEKEPEILEKLEGSKSHENLLEEKEKEKPAVAAQSPEIETSRKESLVDIEKEKPLTSEIEILSSKAEDGKKEEKEKTTDHKSPSPIDTLTRKESLIHQDQTDKLEKADVTQHANEKSPIGIEETLEKKESSTSRKESVSDITETLEQTNRITDEKLDDKAGENVNDRSTPSPIAESVKSSTSPKDLSPVPKENLAFDTKLDDMHGGKIDDFIVDRKTPSPIAESVKSSASPREISPARKESIVPEKGDSKEAGVKSSASSRGISPVRKGSIIPEKHDDSKAGDNKSLASPQLSPIRKESIVTEKDDLKEDEVKSAVPSHEISPIRKDSFIPEKEDLKLGDVKSSASSHETSPVEKGSIIPDKHDDSKADEVKSVPQLSPVRKESIILEKNDLEEGGLKLATSPHGISPARKDSIISEKHDDTKASDIKSSTSPQLSPVRKVSIIPEKEDSKPGDVKSLASSRETSPLRKESIISEKLDDSKASDIKLSASPLLSPVRKESIIPEKEDTKPVEVKSAVPSPQSSPARKESIIPEKHDDLKADEPKSLPSPQEVSRVKEESIIPEKDGSKPGEVTSAASPHEIPPVRKDSIIPEKHDDSKSDVKSSASSRGTSPVRKESIIPEKHDDLKASEVESSPSPREVSPSRKQSLTQTKFDDKETIAVTEADKSSVFINPLNISLSRKSSSANEETLLTSQTPRLSVDLKTEDKDRDEKIPSSITGSVKSSTSPGDISPAEKEDSPHDKTLPTGQTPRGSVDLKIDDLHEDKKTSPIAEIVKPSTSPDKVTPTEKENLVHDEMILTGQTPRKSVDLKIEDLDTGKKSPSPITESGKSPASPQEISPAKKESLTHDEMPPSSHIPRKSVELNLDEFHDANKISSPIADSIKSSESTPGISPIRKESILSDEKDKSIEVKLSGVASPRDISPARKASISHEEEEKLDGKPIENKPEDIKSLQPSLGDIKPLVPSQASLVIPSGSIVDEAVEKPSDKVDEKKLDEKLVDTESLRFDLGDVEAKTSQETLPARKDSVVHDENEDLRKLSVTSAHVSDKKSDLELEDKKQRRPSIGETKSTTSSRGSSPEKKGRAVSDKFGDPLIDAKSSSPVAESEKSSVFVNPLDIHVAKKEVPLQDEAILASQIVGQSVDSEIEDLNADKKTTSPITGSVKSSASPSDISPAEKESLTHDKTVPASHTPRQSVDLKIDDLHDEEKTPSPSAESVKSAVSPSDISHVKKESSAHNEKIEISGTPRQSVDLKIDDLHADEKTPGPIGESVKSLASSSIVSDAKAESPVHDEKIPTSQTPRYPVDLKIDNLDIGKKTPSPVAESVKSSSSRDTSPVRKESSAHDEKISTTEISKESEVTKADDLVGEKSPSPITESAKSPALLHDISSARKESLSHDGMVHVDGGLDKKPSPIAEKLETSPPSSDISPSKEDKPQSPSQSPKQSVDLKLGDVHIDEKSKSSIAENVKSSSSPLETPPARKESLVHDDPLQSTQTPRQSVDLKLDEAHFDQKSASPITKSVVPDGHLISDDEKTTEENKSSPSPQEIPPLRKESSAFGDQNDKLAGEIEKKSSDSLQDISPAERDKLAHEEKIPGSQSPRQSIDLKKDDLHIGEKSAFPITEIVKPSASPSNISAIKESLAHDAQIPTGQSPYQSVDSKIDDFHLEKKSPSPIAESLKSVGSPREISAATGVANELEEKIKIPGETVQSGDLTSVRKESIFHEQKEQSITTPFATDFEDKHEGIHGVFEDDPDLASRSRSSSMASEFPEDRRDEKFDVKSSMDMSMSMALDTAQILKTTELDAAFKKITSPVPPADDDDTFHEVPSRDRSRSHSLFEGSEKTPVGRSRAASLFEDDIITKATSRKSSGLSEFPEERETSSKLETTGDEFEVTVANKRDIERYIISQYVSRKIKITMATLEEIISLYDVPSHIIIEIIQEICDTGRISKESIIDFEIDAGDQNDSAGLIKRSESTYIKRIDTENYITDEYIKKNKKISWKIIEEISVLKDLHVNLILEIIEFLVLQRKIPRMSLLDEDVIARQSTERKASTIKEVEEEEIEGQMKGHGGIRMSYSEMETGYSGESTPHEFDSPKRSTEDHYEDKYESPFHKAFVGGMREIRTTHITTLSGKSTPDVGMRTDTPDSGEFAVGNVERVVREIPDSDSFAIKSSVATESEPEYETIVKRSDPIVIKRTIVTEGGPEYQTVVKTIEPTIIKRTVVSEDDPECETQTIIKKTIVREVIEDEDGNIVEEHKGISKSDIDEKISQMMSKSLGQSSSGRSTPDKIRESPVPRSSTGTPDSFCSSEVIRTTITKTRTISGEGEIITTTKEVTETTNERGETTVLEEKVDVKTSAAELGTEVSHQWIEEKHEDSEEEEEEDPLSGKSQVFHLDKSGDKKVEFSTADMSSSFYGALPNVPQAKYDLATNEGKHGSTKSAVDDDRLVTVFSRKVTDAGDFDVDKVLRSDDGEADDEDESNKDPLKDWGSPLKLPHPERPEKFNLRTTPIVRNSLDMSPDSLNFDVINSWGEPLRLPSPAPGADDASNKAMPTTPKKDKKSPRKIVAENLKNKKRSDSPAGKDKKKDQKKVQPVYLDLTYVPHHGNSYYASLEFFKRVRARYYVFSGTEPSREVYDALLDAKKTWENKNLEVTMIPTYDTDTLGYWVADNEEALAANHIDLSPSASRCTINLQDHETSCSAYRLEF